MRYAVLAIALSCAAAASAAPLEPESVLVKRGDVEVTLRDFEAALASAPEQIRAQVANDPQRIARFLEAISKNRLLASQARQRDLHEQPAVETRLRLAQEELLAKAMMDRILEENPAEASVLEQQAREYYLANPEEFMTDPQVDVSHILVRTPGEASKPGAREVADDIANRAKSGDVSFDTLVEEYRNQPGRNTQAGELKGVARTDLVQPFAEAAFSLEPGGIAGPVETGYGLHIIRLDEKIAPRKKEFSEVREQLVARMRKAHEDRVRSEFLTELLNDNELQAEPEVIRALRDRYREAAGGASKAGDQ